MGFLHTIRFILNHPLNRHRPLPALLGFMRWQIGSTLLTGAVAVPFVNGTRLLTRRGMTGATQNIYCGIQEFEEMGFVLHALRPGDLFVDVGANIGSYTILAAGVCEADAIAIEPVPSSFVHLMDNVRLNDLQTRVTALNTAVGDIKGCLRFTANLDTMNHVISDSEDNEQAAISVPVDTIDSILMNKTPTVMKIDVEGYETKVLKGAQNILSTKTLLAVMMEINGSGDRYGFDDARLHSDMTNLGFARLAYDPLTRALAPQETRSIKSGNALYARDVSALAERVKSAPRRTVHGTRL